MRLNHKQKLLTTVAELTFSLRKFLYRQGNSCHSLSTKSKGTEKPLTIYATKGLQVSVRVIVVNGMFRWTLWRLFLRPLKDETKMNNYILDEVFHWSKSVWSEILWVHYFKTSSWDICQILEINQNDKGHQCWVQTVYFQNQTLTVSVIIRIHQYNQPGPQWKRHILNPWLHFHSLLCMPRRHL